ncbi:uncharacterized protein I206_107507 [Kwoniella pini CBS 10737]|uniref:NTF2 domain-containing protein n=1 Tax=Kwoniella pini CBS 10737 TaxID=1296096 RepID=A0A1B9HXG6_9TREE|nr:uncharacterized protein I206_05835 [Kwoniella pini CBS 10737]OCF47969.1 hypothetical protein I206_05835 [Kwoniella pini CBS 10737]
MSNSRIIINSSEDLENHYKEYISTINKLPNSSLDLYLSNSINHNDKLLNKKEYHQLIIPNSNFKIMEIISDLDKRIIASRLDITLGNNGKKVKEIVFYKLNDYWEIERVWSIVEFL